MQTQTGDSVVATPSHLSKFASDRFWMYYFAAVLRGVSGGVLMYGEATSFDGTRLAMEKDIMRYLGDYEGGNGPRLGRVQSCMASPIVGEWRWSER